MKVKQMDKFTRYCNFYFNQDVYKVLHRNEQNELHVDVLLYAPNEKYPFWKLVTMGVCDYKMPFAQNAIGNNNEYFLFVDKSVNLDKQNELRWYYDKLLTVALFAYKKNIHVSFGHSFEWKNEDSNDGVIGAYLSFPQILDDPNVLRFQYGFFKTTICLQVVLLRKNELDLLKEIGPQEFSERIYPSNNAPASVQSIFKP